MGKNEFFLTIILLFLISLNLSAAPNIPPAPNPAQPINDFANMLAPSSVSEMEQIATALKKASDVDLVVVTVPSIDNYPIEDYALQLFRQWKLGDKTKNNGVLLLVNQENALTNKSGKVRIEVGYGLEGAIPDGRAGRILDEYVLIPWSDQDFDLGIFQGFMALAALIANEYDLDLDTIQELSALKAYDVQESEIPFWIQLLIIVIIIYFYTFIIKKRRRPSRGSTPFGNDHWGGPFLGGGFGGSPRGRGPGGFGGFGGFGGGSSGGGGASR